MKPLFPERCLHSAHTSKIIFKVKWREHLKVCALVKSLMHFMRSACLRKRGHEGLNQLRYFHAIIMLHVKTGCCFASLTNRCVRLSNIFISVSILHNYTLIFKYLEKGRI